MRILIIGATGHIGTYLVPRLVQAGHEVSTISRGIRQPYLPHPVWKKVTQIHLDRGDEDRNDAWISRVVSVAPDVVMDMICFEEASARRLVDALRGKLCHYICCGTIWVHGYSTEVPTTEDAPRNPFGEYGINKAALEAYLLREARQNGFPATILHPGHITGRGWIPINPAGHLDPDVFTRLARGRKLDLPNLGLETVHHVHADDVARAFIAAMEHRSVAVGESFHVVSPAALTLRGYAEGIAAWFGQEANLGFIPWDQWKTTIDQRSAEATWDHIAHSPNCSIDKARRLLGFEPGYRSLEAVFDALDWLIQAGVVTTA